MYKTYWQMEFNPFTKEIDVNSSFKGADYYEALKRMGYLKKVRGIGLFTGLPGTGKTFCMRAFSDALNKNLFKIVYLPLTTIPAGDFYRALARGLGLEPAYRKVDNFRNIQDRMKDMARSQKMIPVILIDEAQYLSNPVLADLKILMNFDMDSQNYAILILSGQPELNETLSMKIHEALSQRIVINYSFQGISGGEVVGYVNDRLSLCGVKRDIFGAGALDAAAGVSNGSIRRLNSLIHKALMIGCDENKDVIDTDTIMKAAEEISLL